MALKRGATRNSAKLTFTPVTMIDEPIDRNAWQSRVHAALPTRMKDKQERHKGISAARDTPRRCAPTWSHELL
jgi:hypothetical protein